MDGDTVERCGEAREEALRTVFNQLYRQGVVLEGVIPKPNMVLPGSTCPKQETVEDVADATVRCLLRSVPAAVPGIAFLSGGQSAELASARLNPMNVRFVLRLPWALAFSFARAIQQPGVGDLARRRGPRIGGTESSELSSEVQPRCASRRIRCRDGKGGAPCR